MPWGLKKLQEQCFQRGFEEKWALNGWLNYVYIYTVYMNTNINIHTKDTTSRHKQRILDFLEWSGSLRNTIFLQTKPTPLMDSKIFGFFQGSVLEKNCGSVGSVKKNLPGQRNKLSFWNATNFRYRRERIYCGLDGGSFSDCQLRFTLLTYPGAKMTLNCKSHPNIPCRWKEGKTFRKLMIWRCVFFEWKVYDVSTTSKWCSFEENRMNACTLHPSERT